MTRLTAHIPTKLILGVAAAAALACTCPAASLATTITVTTTSDEMNDDGQCSLREAITAANVDGAVFPGAGECASGRGADTIALPAGWFTLTIPGPGEDANAKGDLDIDGTTALVGAGAAFTTIDANHIDRAIQVLPGVTATIQGVTITGGHAPNGGSGSSATGTNGPTAGVPGGNAAGHDGGDGESGGGILNAGTLTILDSVISGNAAGSGGPGGTGTGGAGASSTDGAAGGSGRGGDGGYGGDGGGIQTGSISLGLPASLTLVRTAVGGNTAGAGGAGGTGAGGDGGRATTGVGGPGGSGTGGGGQGGGSGGGISQEPRGSLRLEQSTISGNAAGAGGPAGPGIGGDGGRSAGDAGGFGGTGSGGGGVFGGATRGISASATVTLTDDLIEGNVAGDAANGARGAGGAGGGDAGTGGDGGHGGDGKGGPGGSGGDIGGIEVLDPHGTLLATNDTFTANSTGAGGAGRNGIGGPGGSALASETGGDGGSGLGGRAGGGGFDGGLAVGPAILAHATITANSLRGSGDPGAGRGGAPGTGGTGGSAGTGALGSPGSAGSVGGLLAVPPTTLQNSVVAGNATPSCDGTITDGGHDITFPDATCTGTTVDPRLGPLADDGGPTETQALDPGSPAIDAIPATGAGCAATDQRGVIRPQGSGCDIGAYEHAPPSATTGVATAISSAQAALGGQLNPNGRPTSYHFEYGRTTAYGGSTTPQDASAGVAAVAVSAALTGLAPATSYHYRLVASNADGTTSGSDHTFTTTTTGGVPGKRGAPRFLSASVRPTVFAVKHSDPAGKHRRSRTPAGATFHFRLSEAARVVFTIQHILPGRRIGRACRPPTKSNRKHRPCTLLVKPRRFAVSAADGTNTIKFSGRIAGRALPPGNYLAILVATDAEGTPSAPKRLSFRVVRG